MIRTFALLAKQDPENAPHLYRAVAETIRSRVLQAEDAAVIAEWFDRLAAGEAANKVFPLTRPGRPKKKSSDTQHDDIDIAWMVRQNVAKIPKGATTPQRKKLMTMIYKGVAAAHRLKPATVANIYSRVKKQEGW